MCNLVSLGSIRKMNYCKAYLTKLLLTFTALTLSVYVALAQRRFALNDSTTYAVGTGDTIVVGRYKVYKKTVSGLLILKEFNDTVGTVASGLVRGWIRDFDYWSDKKWHLILGKPNFGEQTILYKTVNAGLSWTKDTAYYPASYDRSLNQMQIIDSLQAFLFDGYYFSYVLKTNNGGQTWTRWIESLFAHHYGIFICQPTEYYLWGLYGDGFASYMFKIPEEAYSANNYSISCNLNPSCITAPTSILYNVDRFFKPIFDSLCLSSVAIQNHLEHQVYIYPNPVYNLATIKTTVELKKWTLKNHLGRIVKQGKDETILMNNLPVGVYFMELATLRGDYFFKIIKL